jgi:hypothetical protein
MSTFVTTSITTVIKRVRPLVAPLKVTAPIETFTLKDIKNVPAITKDYIKQLSTYLPCTLKHLMECAKLHCPELCEKSDCSFTSRDKGSAGKLVESYIFGQAPNNKAEPDLLLGDIKATHVKKMGKANAYNAKERLTITNVGATSDYKNLQHILDYDLEANPRWEKIYQGILVVLEHTEGQWSTQEKVLNERVVGFFHYNITENPLWMEAIKADYEKIRDCVRAEAATQKGQQYLHIHPHGSKDSSTRAFGFTNKFVTHLIAHYTGRPLIESGKSLYFEL